LANIIKILINTITQYSSRPLGNNFSIAHITNLMPEQTIIPAVLSVFSSMSACNAMYISITIWLSCNYNLIIIIYFFKNNHVYHHRKNSHLYEIVWIILFRNYFQYYNTVLTNCRNGTMIWSSTGNMYVHCGMADVTITLSCHMKGSK
jgi:hypothetical protein